MDEVTDRLLAFLTHLNKRTQSEVFRLAGDLELTLSQLRVLFVLAHCDHPPALTELAAAIGLSTAAAGRAVDALVRAGVVSRREDEADRRVKRLGLTPHGEEMLERIAAARREGLREFVAGLDDRAREQLSLALRLIPADAACAPAPTTHPDKTTDVRNPDTKTAGGAGGLDRATLAIAWVVVVGSIMAILDTTVVNVAIDHLTRDFDTSLSTIQWIVTGYMLALATVIPLTGWAAHRFGTKRLYIVSIALFMAGSALAGAAWSAESLIAFRVLQGLGGGMIMPAGMTILTQAAGPRRIGRVMAIVGVPMLIGPILGPILGGWLVDDVSWRWIFYINVPIGILALTLATRILPKDEPSPTERLDALGVVLLSPGLAALIYGLAQTASDGFGSAQVLVPLIAGAVLIVAFVLHALRRGNVNPLLDLRLFRTRSVAAAALTITLFGIAFFGAMILLPLYFQTVRGEGAFDTGLLLAPQGLGAMVMMPIAGTLTDRIGPGKLVLVGIPVIAATMVVLTQLTEATSYWLIGTALFVMGLGMGATMMPTMSAAFQTLRHAEVPRATTALNIIQQVGGAIGTAVMSVLLTSALTDRLPGAGGGAPEGGASAIPPNVREQVAPLMADAFGSVFVWAVVFLGVALLPALLLPRSKPAPHDDDAADAAPVLAHA